jgi:serine/threonine protein kinase
MKKDRLSMSSAPQQEEEEDEFADEEDMFDDFVVIQKPDLVSKYNQKEKIEKADVLLKEDSGAAAQCVIGKPGSQGEVVTLDDFKIKRVIDKGSFGKVFLVFNQKTNQLYALKRINKDVLIEKKQISNIKNEKDILFQASHPFVNSMDYVFQNETRIYFFLKFIPGGNIYDSLYKVKRFQESTVKFIAAQIVLAMGYLHSNNVVHRDLKPENVLVDTDGYICLADFGLAKFLNSAQD